VLLRVAGGFCISGAMTAIESWLDERSANETRGCVLGFYMLSFYLAVATGQTKVNPAARGRASDDRRCADSLSLAP
jgi:hypothetical protein